MNRSRRAALSLTFALAVLLVACGSDEPEAGSATEANGEAVADADSSVGSDPDAPPPLEMIRGDSIVSLEAWTYCWTPPSSDSGVCSDGGPPPTLKRLSGDGPVTLRFPINFTFVASVYDAAYKNQIGDAVVTVVDDGWEIDPAVDGPAVLEVFGRGVEGDVIVSVAID